MGTYATREPSGDSAPSLPIGSGRASGNTPSTAIVNSRLNRPFSLMRDDANRTRLPSGVHPVTRSVPGW